MGIDPTITGQELHVPFKATVRHASASRKVGESVWVEAKRNGLSGFGEGCPRPYVTGERVGSCMTWYKEHLVQIQSMCTSFSALKAWTEAQEELLDKSPAAWCAVELALLELFAREENQSVEKLVGLQDPQRAYTYTAIMGDDDPWRYKVVLDMYLVPGFTDFKVKLSGDLGRDRDKLIFLDELAEQHKVGPLRVRLDANNLWRDHPGAVVGHLQALNRPFFALEEPVMPRDVSTLSQISTELDTTIILDESLCSYADLEAYDGVAGRFMANIKVSRVGGILRALRLVKGLQDRGWPIIVGAHVGETSVLTRAAMCVAQAAGNSLVAQEGGFGSILVEHEPAQPSLSYGHRGIIDLSKPYVEKTVDGLRVYPPSTWNTGWGVTARTPEVDHPDGSTMRVIKMPDQYDIHYRMWGPESGEEVIVILHGGMSHSAWQAPLAQAVRSQSAISVVAPDRRGCGLNANKGDFGSVHHVIQDVIEQVNDLKNSFDRVHLAGWCQGAQYAALAAERLQASETLASLLLITPGFFWNERLRSVIDSVKMSIDRIVDSFDLAPDRNMAFAPVPLEETDFTTSEKWLDYIRNDEHKSTELSLKSVFIMDEIQELSWFAIRNIRLPLFAVVATGDRIVDNQKVESYLDPIIKSSPQNYFGTIDTGHAVQFENPEALAKQLINFMAAVQ